MRVPPAIAATVLLTMGCVAPVQLEERDKAGDMVDVLIQARCGRAVTLAFIALADGERRDVSVPATGELRASVRAFSRVRVAVDPEAWSDTWALIEDHPETLLRLEHFQLGSRECSAHVIRDGYYVNPYVPLARSRLAADG